VARIGIDVGGTKCLGVVVDADGVVLDEVRHATPTAEELIDVLCDIVSHFQSFEIESVGVGVPGLVTRDGVFRVSPHIRGISDLAMQDILNTRLGIRTIVDNDATAAAFAEFTIGAARGTKDAIIVALGTGIGGGIVMGGQLQRGTNGFAGEFGHFVVDVNGSECDCGQRGCWETYASGDALRRLSGGLDGQEVMSRAARGDEMAQRVVEEFSHWIAVGLATLVNICDPEIIVIGGGVVVAGDQFLHKVPKHLSDVLYASAARPIPQIVPAALGEKAGAIGSALMGGLQ
jgi:glucokinase